MVTQEATDLFDKTMTDEEINEVTSESPDAPATGEKHLDDVFTDFIDKLCDSQEKIAKLKKSADKIIKNKKLPAEEKQAQYMELFNAAVLSFIRLPRELERLCKTEKQRLWQAKERALKQIY